MEHSNLSFSITVRPDIESV